MCAGGRTDTCVIADIMEFISLVVLLSLMSTSLGQRHFKQDEVPTMGKANAFWRSTRAARCGLVKVKIVHSRALGTSERYVDDELELNKYVNDVPQLDRYVNDVPQLDRYVNDVPQMDKYVNDVPQLDKYVNDVPQVGKYVNDVPQLDKHVEDVSDFDKILGGNYVVPGAIPWQVNLEWKRGTWIYKHYCGGAIVNEFWILTAARCIYGVSAGDVKVVVGDHNLARFEPHERKFDVEMLLPHEKYRGETFTDDIGLIKIKTPRDVRGMKFTDYIQPVCLPIGDNTPADGAMLLVSGWGETFIKRGVISDILKQTYLPIVNQGTCEQFLKDFPIAASVFCAGYVHGNTDLCQGDTGGPAVYKTGAMYVLHGIVSFGTGCDMPNYPIGFTRVTAYLEWIAVTIQQHSDTVAQQTIPSRPKTYSF